MPRRTNTQVSARGSQRKARGVRGVKGLCRVQVNSEQVGLESLVEAGEGLCRPDISRETSFHHCGARTYIHIPLPISSRRFVKQPQNRRGTRSNKPKGETKITALFRHL